MNDNPTSIYLDLPQWHPPVEVDDFVVAVGQKRSNTVYHVLEVKKKAFPKKRIIRYYIKALRSDLLIALKRSYSQKLYTLKWYRRSKSKKANP